MSTQAVEAGGAEVEVRIRDRLKEQMPKIVERLKSTGETVAKIGATMAAASAAGMAVFTAAAKSFSDSGTELLAMSHKTGVAVEVLSELQYAAARTGATMSDVEEIITAIKDGKQAELWASSSAGVIRLLQSNMAGLRREARGLGMDMSGQVAQSAQDLSNALQTSAFVVGTVWREIGASAAPAVTSLTKQFTAAVGPVVNFIRNNRAVIGVMFITLQTVARVGAGLASLGRIISMAGVAIGFLGGAFAPLLIGAAIVGTIATAIYLFRDTVVAAWRAVAREIAPVISAVRALYSVFAMTIGGVTEALLSGQFQSAAAIAWAGFVAAAWTGIEQLADAVDVGLQYLQSFFPGVDSVIAFFREQFGGLFDAILAGRWDIAGQILMTKLHIVWREGLDFLLDAWDMAMTTIKSAFPGVVQFVSDLWHGMIDGIASAIVWLMEKTGMAAEGTMGMLKQMQAEEARARDKAMKQDPTKVMNDRMLAREQNRKQLQAQLATLENQAAKAYEQAGSPTVADAAAQAREALRKEIEKARKAREPGDGKDIPGPGLKDGPVSLPNYKTEGSFTAAAAVVLGNGGSVNEKIEQNTRAMAKGIASINDNTKRRGAIP